jgi:hypothetical protein
MHGLAFVIAATMCATPPADDTFLLCASCQQPADFAKVVTAKAYHRPGAFRDLVGNPDTGTIYVVEYVVKEGSPSAEVTLERRANEVAEQQFRELVDETTRSKALLEKH